MNQQQWDEHIARCADSLHRLTEFRNWLDTNVLFPTVPDTIVHPLKEQLRNAEHKLVAVLYDARAIDKAAAIQKVVDVERRR